MSIYFASRCSDQEYIIILLKRDLLTHWNSEIKKHIDSFHQNLFQVIEKDPIFRIQKQTRVLLVPLDLLSLVSCKFLCFLLIIDEAHSFSASAKYTNHISALFASRLLFLTALPESNPVNLFSLLGLETIFLHLPNYEYAVGTRSVRRPDEGCASLTLKKLRFGFLHAITIRDFSDAYTQQSMTQAPQEQVTPNLLILPTSKETMDAFLDLAHWNFNQREAKELFWLVANMENLNTKQKARWNAIIFSRNDRKTKAKNGLAYVNSTSNCSICNHIFFHPVQLECNHVFCIGCLTQWFLIHNGSSCPLCRNRNDAFYLPNFPDITNSPPSMKSRCGKNNTDLAKLEQIRTSLQQLSKTTQLLLYTQYEDDAILFYNMSLQFGHSAEIAGFKDIRKARHIIQQFHDKQINVLILNIVKLAQGIEFPDVRHMIIVDFDNVVHLSQAIHRIGGSRLGSSIKGQETGVSILTHTVSVEGWFWKLYCQHVIKSPSINGHSPSQVQWLELEYFLTCNDKRGRMFLLSGLVKKLGGTRFQFSIPSVRTHKFNRRPQVWIWKGKTKIGCFDLGTYALQSSDGALDLV